MNIDTLVNQVIGEAGAKIGELSGREKALVHVAVEATMRHLSIDFKGVQSSLPLVFSTVLERNPWSLYSSTPGWEDCEARLNAALNAALAHIDKEIANGVPLSRASMTAFNSVMRVMDLPENNNFGANDSEPRDRLGYMIGKHLKGAVRVNRFGDVEDRG